MHWRLGSRHWVSWLVISFSGVESSRQALDTGKVAFADSKEKNNQMPQVRLSGIACWNIAGHEQALWNR